MKMLVSICIPAYKQPQLLKKAIESVLMQTYTNYEIIVTDDTPDNSIKELVEQFNEPKIKYHKNASSLGSPENWNKAISLASGSYIKLLHHDDHFRVKDALHKYVSAFEADPALSFVFSYSDIYFKKDNEHFFHEQTNAQLKRIKTETEFLFFRNCIGSPSAVIFKNDKNITFNNEYVWLVDVEFYIRYLNKHKTFKCIHEALVTIVDGGDEQVTKEVSVNKDLVVKENINLFSTIYSEKLNTKKAFLFFQELFLSFEIDSLEKLKLSFVVPLNVDAFMADVFIDLSKDKILKKVKKRLLTSRYNKRFFKIERF